jgi:hypothetical protein
VPPLDVHAGDRQAHRALIEAVELGRERSLRVARDVEREAQRI